MHCNFKSFLYVLHKIYGKFTILFFISSLLYVDSYNSYIKSNTTKIKYENAYKSKFSTNFFRLNFEGTLPTFYCLS